MSSAPRVGLVVQRYGNEVNGGAETLARRVAELLAPHLDLTVLTTCALDYLHWEDHFPPGPADVNGVRVVRFAVPEPRVLEEFERLSAAAYAAPKDTELGRRWIRSQGPHAPELLAHLEREGERYDAVVFVTYLYATTAEALPLVASRSLLLPAMHEEPPLRLHVFDEVFDSARLLLFSTPEELELAQRRFGVEDERARVVGAGVDELGTSDPERFRAERRIERPYALYVGRLDVSKGVVDLVEHHLRYRARRPDGLDLVLVGGGSLPLPAEPWLHRVGFVSEQAKHDALAGASVVVCPSPYESLSLAQIEAWTHGKPTLANAVSPVLVGNSRRSGGGLWYDSGETYVAMLDALAGAPPLAEAIGRQGRRYARAFFSWDHVRDAWLEAIREVAGTPAAFPYTGPP
jgi:glycosyltransferase involved in cell wall biosynthesis